MMALIRFAMVGGAFSAIYALVTAGLTTYANSPPFVTAVVVYLVCIPAAFAAQAKFAFRQKPAARGAAVIYAGTQLASLALVVAVTGQFVTGLFWFDTLIYLVSAGAAALASFAICRWIIFAPKAPDA
jgi:putative flippase GtrA